ncbi:MAG: AbrB/MazE/SpoVT family DNA-binding domain-containing protein [Chloroflexi bacterium]|jgi:AbrB family looped-hinge helix DNA binding protein|nr:AbrB/MazE/SpoVT family DNA-binding domain-containing protein [Chloroflexota bacterium]
MDIKHVSPEYKCLGSITVNPRGQVVIPANARRELGIKSGDTLLVFKILHDQVLALVKVGTLEQVLRDMSKHMADLERLMKEHKPEAASKGKGD